MNRYSRGSWIDIVAALLLLVAAASPAVQSAEGTLEVSDRAVAGSVVLVTVVNTGTAPATGTVVVEAVVSGQVVVGSQPIAVSGNSVGYAPVGFSGPVKSVINAGVIIDDPTPI